MNFKETFLKLTEYTIPYGHESDIIHLLPSGVKKDKWGNYFLRIGESNTLFTCHLDTYCVKKEKVNHIIEGNIIKTDEKTILGGDNKAGVTCIFYMIEQGIPGFYYFFIGEEPILSGGLYGSSKLLQGYPDFLREFDRAIAFDRKKMGSIITRQMAQWCCSNEFADSLISEFNKCGVSMKKDPTGYYTDTGNFLEVISECTNISIGVWNEHHNNEYVDISYVEKISKAACQINWENLPTVRIPKYPVDDTNNVIDDNTKLIKKYKKFHNGTIDSKLFRKVNNFLSDENYVLITRTGFKPGKEMIFDNWFKEDFLKIIIQNGSITMNGNKVYAGKKLQDNILKLLK